VLSTAAGVLLRSGADVDPTVRDALVDIIVVESTTVGECLVVVPGHASERFVVAAAGIAASGALLGITRSGASNEMLADLLADCAVVRGELG
jgi:hypothetical protein